MNHEPEEPVLFDLPLASPPGGAGEVARAEGPPRRAGRRSSRPESLPLFGEEEMAAASAISDAGAHAEPQFAAIPAEAARGPVAVPRVTSAAQSSLAPMAPTPPLAPLARRLLAAGGDLAILCSVGAAAAIGASLLGAELVVASLAPLLVFLLSFSFLYCVVSLAFWGQTPGMAWCGLIARSEVTEPLSFGQTAMRWLGHWLTWGLLGLPGLLALSGRSLADRLSGSSTYELPLPENSAA